ncbi:hypothetical protein [Zhouia amylolytica]|uniref:hypothetical protein n=1 Tax=Zhouia amylolytica TaxID=376730 RepID=UPI0020CE0E9D|nr:hypothetical protein [Zhouia amylolytica]MCQ0111454.1 hypothetical protein [Zhouia amylolytica]
MSISKMDLKFFKPILLVFVLLVISCKNDKKSESNTAREVVEIKVDSVMELGMVDILTTAMEFQMPDTLPAGWLHLRYKNASAEPHFFILEKYPEGVGIEEAKKEIVPVFQDAMDSIMVDRFEAGMKRFDSLPAWYQEVVFHGGSGLISPGKVSNSYVNLQPGTYLIECYVKMPNGKFHSSMGMLKQFEVVDKWSSMSQPKATVDLTVSSDQGITFDGDVSSGDHVFSVFFKDAKIYGNFVNHDVHLVKLEDEDAVDNLNSWMNWLEKDGFISPGPQGVVFLGGSQEMPMGSTTFFRATLTPGLYGLIAEVPDSKAKGLFKTFTVSE